MKSTAFLLPLLLLSACGTLQHTAMSGDDVYDIPDQSALAASTPAEQSAPEPPIAGHEDYYNDADARNSTVYRDYYDLTYNDPYYYNYGRFGFGTGLGNYGPGWGMGLSYGWPTTFGSMSIGYGWGSLPYGYDPYWSNSWMSGYGYQPFYGYGPYGYYGYGQYGYGYGGYGMGYGPYQGPWGGCYGCYEPIGYGTTVYSHRPSMSSVTGSTNSAAPRMAARNPASLLPGPAPTRQPDMNSPAWPTRQGRNISAPEAPSRSPNRAPSARPERGFDISPSNPSRSTGGGNSGGGGHVTSPRPR